MTVAAGISRPFWHLVEESFSEASFLWTRLDTALHAHNYVLAEVHTWVEDRLLGALDGVRVAGAAAIEPLLGPALQSDDPGAVSSSVYLLSVMSSAQSDKLLEHGLREATPQTASAYGRALGRAAQVEALRSLWRRVQDASPQARAAVLEALSFCGQAPEADWLSLLSAEAACLRVAAADALRFAPASALHEVAGHAFASADHSVRDRALTAGVAAGDSTSWRRCVALTRAADADASPLLALVAMLGAEREHAPLFDALSTATSYRDALWALGCAGTTRAAEACLAQLREGPHAPLAAEAFCAITGLELAREGLVLDQTEPEREPPTLEDDDLDAELVPSADEELPQPDVEGVSAWWATHRARFASNVRYVAGRPASFPALCEALGRVSTRRRHALALELAARTGGACLLQPWAFTRVQHRQLQAFPRVSDAALNNIARGLGFARLETS